MSMDDDYSECYSVTPSVRCRARVVHRESFVVLVLNKKSWLNKNSGLKFLGLKLFSFTFLRENGCWTLSL